MIASLLLSAPVFIVEFDMKVVKITFSPLDKTISNYLLVLKRLKTKINKKVHFRNFRMSEIYLDYNATTPIDKRVIEAINRSLYEDWGNPSSTHSLGAKAKVDL